MNTDLATGLNRVTTHTIPLTITALHRSVYLNYGGVQFINIPLIAAVLAPAIKVELYTSTAIDENP